MSKKRKEREHRGIVRDYGLAIGGSILVALFIRFFVIEAYRMPSRAMQPAIEPGDTLFVSKFSYGIRLPGAGTHISPRTPEYGDVVVLEFPEEPGREYIKRVVGLPGDRVLFTKGIATLNGKPLGTETSASELCAKETLPNSRDYTICFEAPLYSTEKEVTVPAGQVFVVGDMRSMPMEMRRLRTGGLVPFDQIKGRDLFIWLSIQPPSGTGSGGDWFSRIRFDRLFHKIH